MRNLTKAFVLIMLLVPTAAVFAQQTNYEVRRGTVVTTFNDQLVFKTPTGEVKQVTIPPGFKFTVNGQQVGLADLTPGTELTATIKTTTTPITVHETKIRNGQVVKVAGSSLWVKENNEIKTFTIPKGFKFIVDGQKVGIEELRPGQNLTAEIVYKSERVDTTREVNVAGSTPPPPPAPVAEAAPAPTPEPAPAAPAELPKTASELPLIALLGVSMIGAGIALRRA